MAVGMTVDWVWWCRRLVWLMCSNVTRNEHKHWRRYEVFWRLWARRAYQVYIFMRISSCSRTHNNLSGRYVVTGLFYSAGMCVFLRSVCLESGFHILKRFFDAPNFFIIWKRYLRLNTWQLIKVQSQLVKWCVPGICTGYSEVSRIFAVSPSKCI